MIRSQHAHLPVVALTDPGLRGKNNEDRFGILALRQEEADSPPALLAVLADGIGGHRAGEVAAEMTVNLIAGYVLENGDKLPPPALLEEAITTASTTIYEQAQANRERKGMGATCACVYVLGDRLYTASVGDSRIYLLRGGAIHQLTTDHTWIQEALERGLIDPQDARHHPNMHVIRRYLGSTLPPRPDLRLRLRPDETDAQAEANQGAAIQAGDVFLLCTDGLTDLVTDEEIEAILSDHGLEAAAQTLIDLACQRGGHDNITVVLIAVPAHFRPPRLDSRLRLWLIGAAMGVILLTLILLVTFWALLQALP